MENVRVRYASQDDLELLLQHDRHVDRTVMRDKIDRHEVLVVQAGPDFAGWLRFGLFWDNTPFMNMLYLLPQYRGQGIGRFMVQFWHEQMKAQGYGTVLTSTQQNETAQHFYVALGYQAIGGFNLGHETFEILFARTL
jgi:ribosomal protein S18 acetylase RimI-like enzyme